MIKARSQGKIKRRRGKIMRIIDAVVLILTFAFAIALLSAYLARYIPPEKFWVFAFAGLATPILYVVNFMLVLYWGLRWSKFAIIPIITLLIGLNSISLFFRPSFSKQSNDMHPNSTTVISYNVMGFRYEKEEGGVEKSLSKIADFVKKHNADIFCIQEFECPSTEQKKEVDRVIGLPYSIANYKLKTRTGGGWGLATYSRYPIINSGIIEYEHSTNSSMWVDVVVKTDTIRVFNNHLQTTSVDRVEREYISNHEYMSDNSSREERVRGIASKLRRNFIIRSKQADTIAQLIEQSPYKVIVCGDFNDTPNSYVYSKIADNLADSFVEKGRGVASNTFYGLFNIFRIDYIMHSKEIETQSYDSPAIKYSDHKPVVVEILLPASKQ